MRIFLSIVFFIALIVIITLGFKRNNGFFNDARKLGELNYLTPAAKEVPAATEVTDTTKKAEAVKGEEPKKEGAGETAKPVEGEKK